MSLGAMLFVLAIVVIILDDIRQHNPAPPPEPIDNGLLGGNNEA